MKKHLVTLVMLTGLLAETVQAGTNGYLLNCFCARSYARGGTVVAIPDNSAVILSNPAGLAFMQQRAVGIGLGVLIPRVQFRNDANANTTADQKFYPMPFSGYVDPRPGSKWAWGFGLNVVGGMGAEYQLDHDLLGADQKYYSNFGYIKTGPAFAYRINDQLAVGAGFQLFYGMLDFKMPFSIDPVANLRGVADPNSGMTFGQMFAADPAQGGFGYDEVTAYAHMNGLSGFGAGANIGVFYKVNDRWSVGASYTSPTRMYLKGKATMDMSAQFNDAFGLAVQGIMAQNPGLTQEEAQAQAAAMFTNLGINLQEGVATEYSKAEADFDVPQKVSFGVSYRPTPRWTLGLDLEWIDWSSAFNNMPMRLKSGSNNNINLMINGSTTDGTFEYDFPLEWKDSYNIKAGVDYLWNEGTHLRAGFIHGKNPVPGNTVFAIFPAIVENHATVGFGQKLTKNLTLDVAYILSFNKTLSGSSTDHLVGKEYANSRNQLTEHLIVTSLAIGL